MQSHGVAKQSVHANFAALDHGLIVTRALQSRGQIQMFAFFLVIMTPCGEAAARLSTRIDPVFAASNVTIGHIHQTPTYFEHQTQSLK